MTEAEWLACEDPARMLNAMRREWDKGGEYSLVSDRKLRLLVEAVTGIRSWANLGEGFDWASFAREVAASEPAIHHPPFREQAALLRDIIGNPWRPVARGDWETHLRACDQCQAAVRGRFAGASPGVMARRCCPAGAPLYGAFCQWNSWLTPQVLDLARAAYEERLRPCDICDGARGVREHRAGEVRGTVCPACGDEGVIDGALDPVRLAILADALEEAGCTDEGLLRHLRGLEVCPRCGGKRAMTLTQWVEADEPESNACSVCGGEGIVPLRGPHVRGCWALDLILGKE